jgi:microcystin-dependent protein
MDFSLTVANTDGTSAAYISADKAKNVLTLTLGNYSGSAIAFAAGAPPTTPTPPPVTGPSCVFITFVGPSLVAPADIAGMTVHAAINGSHLKASCVGTAPHAVWVLTAGGPGMVWPNNGILTITIGGFAVPGPAGPGKIVVDGFNIGSSGAFDLQSAVPVLNAPTPAQTQLALSMDFNDQNNAQIFITDDEKNPIANSCVVHLANTNPTTPLVTKSGGAPKFIFWFLCGDKPGYGALTTVDRARAVQVAFSTAFPDAWSCKFEDGPIPHWIMTPATAEILGIGAAALTEFTISNLITELVPGASLAYLQYSGVPGFNDGVVALAFNKAEPQPGIMRFGAVSAYLNYGAQATLTWRTFAINSLTLSYAVDGVMHSHSAPGELTFNGSFKIPEQLHADTVFRLDVVDARSNADNAETTVSILKHQPKITSFTVSPAFLLDAPSHHYVASLQDGPQDGSGTIVTFAWTIADPESVKHVTLSYVDQNGVQQNEELDQTLTRQIAIKHPGVIPYTLTVTSNVDDTYKQSAGILLGTWEDVVSMSTVKPGMVVAYSGPSGTIAAIEARGGWHRCDGSAAAGGAGAAGLGAAIGGIYGAAPAGMVALPDLRGYFLRGMDQGAGRDPDGGGRSVGSFQADALAAHQHGWSHFYNGINDSNDAIAIFQGGNSGELQNHHEAATNFDGGGMETRPQNTAVYYLMALS